MPLHNKCQFGRLAWPPPQTYALVISTDTESGFITENHISSRSHSNLSEVGKNAIDTVYEKSSVVGILMMSFSCVSQSSLNVVSLDTTICMEDVNGVKLIPETLLKRMWLLL
ncbi:hypothetical protein TNCV_2299781 [Trichonephila clavipes]|nr:hypothetical protein TNCV_2299781 [Trichonephila clavipes]